MDYIVLDIETTGLDPEHCEILSIALLKVKEGNIVDNLHIKLPYNDKMLGQRIAFDMNKALIEECSKIEEGRVKVSGCGAIGIDYPQEGIYYSVYYNLGNFCEGIRNFAGKNLAMFDFKFLETKGLLKTLNPRHRVMDPATTYARRGDTSLPDLKTCCERAGIPYDKDKAHDALYDCHLVHALVEKILKANDLDV